jgi:hypothetical protein
VALAASPGTAAARSERPAAARASLACCYGGMAWRHVSAAAAAAAGMRVAEACEALARCSPASFQPLELFPLLPEYTQPWLQQVRQRQARTAPRA